MSRAVVAMSECWHAELAPQGGTGTLAHLPGTLPAPLDLSKRPGAGRRPLALLFEQTDCPNCEELHARTLSLRETRDLLDRYDVAQIDMWSDQALVAPDGTRTTSRALAERLGVTYAPSLVLFDHDGNEVALDDRLGVLRG